jgi:hypothetical protein
MTNLPIYPPTDYLYIPRRGPRLLIDNISHLFQNKVFCEIGCASGYLLNYARNKYGGMNSKLIGCEIRPNAVEYCKSQNLEDVELIDATNDIIDKCDGYFGWFGNHVIECKIIKNLSKQHSNFVLILFFSNSVTDEVLSFETHIKLLDEDNIKYTHELIKIKKNDIDYHLHYNDGFIKLIIYL